MIPTKIKHAKLTRQPHNCDLTSQHLSCLLASSVLNVTSTQIGPFRRAIPAQEVEDSKRETM